MISINRATLLGAVGGIPIIRTTSMAKKMAAFSMATSERYKVGGEVKEMTHWHNIVTFDDSLATLIENYVVKGTKVLVEGQIQTRKYKDKDGNEKSITEIVVGFNGRIILIEKNTAPETVEEKDEEEDDIPF